MAPRKLELLSPARDLETGIQAILHGADAVYIGPRSFGARAAAGNSTDDLARLADFAHTYRAKVYATVNTIFFDHEARDVERLIRDLYKARIDAVIVQDMGILRLDIPPIELHASTQCDIRTPEKARFLQDAGFSQLVLARELTLKEIREICSAVTIPVETFIHGALCVSYSGRCHASEFARGRSANRGECSQLCRLPYTLTDADGKVLMRDRYLFSLRDFNASASLNELIGAGVSSFKIEGRLKDTAYVKNITGHYSRLLNDEIRNSSGALCRSSAGNVELTFTPDPAKSFNRGFTDYFLTGSRPDSISSPLTPKSLGEKVEKVSQLHNGDGISFFTPDGKYTGAFVNGFEGSRLLLSNGAKLPAGTKLRRTYDIEFDRVLKKPSATRKIPLSIFVTPGHIMARDARGVEVALPMPAGDVAKKPFDFRAQFDKFGNTPFILSDFRSQLSETQFYPASAVSAIRRRLLSLLEETNTATYPFSYRRREDKETRFPYSPLDYRDNVANDYARDFYKSHGATVAEPALETQSKKGMKNKVVMTCRHCILRENGRCLRENPDKAPKQPLEITSGDLRFRLAFDCSRCEMQVLTP